MKGIILWHKIKTTGQTSFHVMQPMLIGQQRQLMKMRLTKQKMFNQLNS